MLGLGGLLYGGGVSPGLLGFSGGVRQGVEVAPVAGRCPPAVTCSQFPCHPVVTFHLLATLSESTLLGLYRKEGGGSDVIATWNKKKNCLQGLNDQSSEKSMFLVGRK